MLRASIAAFGRRAVHASAIALLAAVGCAPDGIVQPGAESQSPAVQMQQAALMQQAVLPDAKLLPVPPLNPGTVPRETRFTVPAYANYIVRVAGAVTATWNPQLLSCGYPLPSQDLRGVYFPRGGVSAALLVHGELVNDRGQWTSLTLAYTDTTAASDTLFALYATNVRIGRNGLPGSRWGATCGTVPYYALTSNQYVSVEVITGTHLRVTPAPVVVRRGRSVPFEARWVSDGSMVGSPNWTFTADPGETAATTACGLNGPNPCLVQIRNNGWIAASRSLASRMRGDRGRVRVYDVLALAADRDSVTAGDTVLFTPMLDGQAGGVPRWLWRPQRGSAAAPACGTEGPCRLPVRESGSMWIFSTTVAGIADSAAVTVAVQEQFRLRATPTSVQRGGTVTFAATLNGAPAAPVRWLWRAASGGVKTVACAAGAAECTLRAFGDGQLWAYRTADAGIDSAFAAVTVAVGGDASASCGANDLCDKVRLRVERTAGVGGTPAAGDLVVPLGSVIPYSLHTQAGFKGLAVLIDSTLDGPRADPLARSEASGTLAMDRDRTLIAGTDPDYTARAAVRQIRSGLRQLLDVAATAQPHRIRAAYLRYVEYALNTTPGLVPAGEPLNRSLDLAAYLEIDPVRDAQALRALDGALRHQLFEVRRVAGRTVVTHVPRDENAGDRVRGEPAGASTGRRNPRAPVLLFVTGRRMVHGIADPTQFRVGALEPDARSAWAGSYVWMNESAAGVQYESVQCGELATRDRAWRTLPMTFARFVNCRDDVAASSLRHADLFASARQWLHGRLATPDAQLAPDALDLATVLRRRHDDGQNVIVVGHSHGNVVAAEAFARYEARIAPLQVRGQRCTAMLSLAAPLEGGRFGLVAPELRRGRTIADDITQQAPWGPLLRTDFEGLRSRRHVDDAPSFPVGMPAAEREWRSHAFGLAVHDADVNYFSDPLVAPVLRGLVSELAAACGKVAP